MTLQKIKIEKAEKIIEMVAEYFDYSVDQLKQKPYTPGAKKKYLSIARQTAIVFIKKYTALSDSDVMGMFFRERTVIYDAIKSIEDLVFTDGTFKSFYETLEGRICNALGIVNSENQIDQEFEHLI